MSWQSDLYGAAIEIYYGCKFQSVFNMVAFDVTSWMRRIEPEL